MRRCPRCHKAASLTGAAGLGLFRLSRKVPVCPFWASPRPITPLTPMMSGAEESPRLQKGADGLCQAARGVLNIFRHVEFVAPVSPPPKVHKHPRALCPLIKSYGFLLLTAKPAEVLVQVHGLPIMLNERSPAPLNK